MNTKAVKNKTFIVSRDSKTGKFVDAIKAERRPASTTIERMPKGDGYSGRSSKGGRFVEEEHRVSGKSIDVISSTNKKRSGTLRKLAKR